jgi:hypothetical protein
MDFKSFVDKAKEAAATVSEQAKTAMATPAVQTDPPQNIEAQVASDGGELVPAGEAGGPAVAGQSKSFSALASEKITQLSAVGAEKTQELVTAFQQALPALKSAGYELTEFEIELGVTPKLIPHFRYAAQNAESVGAARETLKANKLGSILLGALLKAGDVHKQINVAGFCFSHIEIELGLIPSVRLQYKNEPLAPGAVS